MKNNIAVLTDCFEFSLFNAVSATVVYAENVEEAKNQFSSLCENYKLIILNETLAENLSEQIKKYDSSAYPMILVLPQARKNMGFAIKKIVKRAKESLGLDIFKE